MGGGPSQQTNSVQSTNQDFSDLSSMVQNMATQGLTNYQNNQNTSNTGTVASNTTNTNQQNQTGTNFSNTSGATTGATSGNTSFANNPWAPAMPQLNNILSSIGGIPMNLTPAQQAALTATSGAAGSMPNFGNAATNAVSNMYSSMNGVPEAGLWGSAYGNYAGALSPFQSLSNLNPMNTPGFSEALFDPVSGINAQIANNTKALFAGAGRDPAGNADASKAIAFGESQADLPALMSQYNMNVTDYLGAAGAQFGAAGNTATGVTNLMQTPFQNQINAIGQSGNVGQLWMQPSQAQLGAANTAYGMPYSNIALPAGMVQQIAGLGQQGTGQQTGTQAGTSTQGTAGGNTSATLGGSTSDTTGTQTQVGQTDATGQQTSLKTASGSTSGTQSGNQKGTSVGNSTTVGSQSPLATAAGIGLGLFSMMP